MKTEYKIKDQVWIHLGERKLTEGRVVEIIDLEHLGEGHSPDRELYVIEIKTGIDDVYEVRDFDQISPDAKGPINLFRKVKGEILKNQRYLNKVGIKIPVSEGNSFVELAKEINEGLADDPSDPTPEQIHAALEKAEKGPTTIFNPTLNPKRTQKKRTFNKRKKTDGNS
jgi:hypothetical protein